MWVVPSFDELKHRHPRFTTIIEYAAIEQFTLQGGKETPAHRVVVTIPY